MPQQIVVPPTTLYTIVFPQDLRTKNYDASFYQSSLTDGRASEGEISQILRQIEVLRKPFHKRIVCAVWLYFLALILCIGLMVVGITTSYGGQYEWNSDYDYYEWVEEDNSGQLFGSIIGGIIGTIIIFAVFISYVSRTSRASRVPVQALFNRVNPDFATRGLRWHIPSYFPRWVELWKDYVNTAQPIGQPTYMPPPMTQQYQNYPAVPDNSANYQMPGAQPQDYQNYGVQPQGYQNYNQPTYTQEGQQGFVNYSANQA